MEPPDLSREKLPRHVAIIMDGNGRWAAQRNLPRIEGHREGARSVRDIVRAARQVGLGALTLFAFSEQNWDRPHDEVEALMELLYRYVLEERSEIMDNDIRLTAAGMVDRLPAFVRQPLDRLMEDSAANDQMVLCLALSYGSREDIVRGARRLAREVQAGRMTPEQIDERTFAAVLSTAGLPAVDLLVRTSGELRLSNFLLWEVAYAELFFTPVNWPDFRREQLFAALAAFQQRERRFGRLPSQT
jgi:undecaprenyl diphosphate synthase